MDRSYCANRGVGLCAVLLGVLFAAAPLHAEEPKAKNYALLVGVKEYDHRKLPALKYTENDAVEMAALLRGAGYEVVLLTSTDGKKTAAAKPTHANIEKQLKALLAKCKKGDTILVGLAGHGLQFDDIQDSFFCPEDALPFSDADSLKTLLSIKAVYQQLDRSAGAVKLLLVDACRNDPSAGRSVGAVGAGSPPPGVAALFSCSAGERAYEIDAYRHGLFFYHVLEGLRGKAKTTDEDEVTWDALQAYVRGKVSDDAPKRLDGVKQTPSLNAGEQSGKSPILISRLVKLAVRARLSLEFNAIDRPAAERLQLTQHSQAQVQFVVPGGGGDLMGLRRDDVIRRINGHDADTVIRARELFDQLAMGDRLELEVLRDKQTVKLTGRYETPLTKAEELRRVRELAQRDDAAALQYLGRLYETGHLAAQDEAEAVKWYRKAADLGDSFAQTNLAALYEKGRGVTRDDAESLKWYRKAANLGSAEAQNHLGVRCQEGRGLPKDDAEAVKWYRKAAEQGYCLAQFNLGVQCENGRGVPKNEAEAFGWYRKAAEQGCVPAQTHLGLCYANGLGVAKDEVEAVKWYRKAAEQGNSAAQTNLGACYANGRGIARDDAEAVQWYRKAAEGGNATAQTHLGYMCSVGRGVAKSNTEAVRWFRKAAEQGNDVAQYNLADCYANGRGVVKDKATAIIWYRKAAEQGNDNAQRAVKRLRVGVLEPEADSVLPVEDNNFPIRRFAPFRPRR